MSSDNKWMDMLTGYVTAHQHSFNKHPVQANLAAPFFTIVEMFKLLGLRDELLNAVQHECVARNQVDAAGMTT